MIKDCKRGTQYNWESILKKNRDCIHERHSISAGCWENGAWSVCVLRDERIRGRNTAKKLVNSQYCQGIKVSISGSNILAGL